MAERRRPLPAAFLAGALAGAGIFVACTLPDGGARPCVERPMSEPASRAANLPARALHAIWPSDAVAPQQVGGFCVRDRAEAFDARTFLLWGIACYALLGGALAALGRFLLGGLLPM